MSCSGVERNNRGVVRERRVPVWRTRAAWAIVAATGILIAGCSAGGEPELGSGSPGAGREGSASATAPDAGDGEGLLDVSDWQVFSNDFLTFSYPDGWTVEVGEDVGDGVSASVRDESGVVVAVFSPGPVDPGPDRDFESEAVQQFDRRAVTTGAGDQQVLLTTFVEPVRDPGIFVGYANAVSVQLMAPEQVEDYLGLRKYAPGYWQNDDGWGVFRATVAVFDADGERVDDPTLEQTREFLETERYRQILAMMASVRD